MLFPPLGLFVASVVGSIYQNELCWLFFSFALIMWLVLFPVTAGRSFFYTQLEDKLRPTVLIYLAASSVACSAYANLNYGIWDNFTRILFWFSWGLFITFACMTLQGFFNAKFEMTSWSYLFPLAAFAICNIQYRNIFHHDLTEAMSVISMVAANLACVLLILHLLIAIFRRNAFVPDEKWGPLSFTKTCHYSMKNVCKKLTKMANSGNLRKSDKFSEFVRLFNLLNLTHTEHAKHEDDIVFPAMNSFFPGATETADREHIQGHDEFTSIITVLDLLQQQQSAESTENLIKQLETEVPIALKHFDDHMDYEEIHLQSIGRKHFPLQLHIQLLREIFNSTDAKIWSVILPFLITNEPLHGYRVRMLKTLRWAVNYLYIFIFLYLYLFI